jgi:hypothetical protein
MASLNLGASTMKTLILKNPRSGWKATTVIDLTPKHQLEIITQRYDGGRLISRATVWRLSDEGTKSHCFNFGQSGGDFGHHIHTSTPARITVNTVTAQHEQALDGLEQIKLLAMAHYGQRQITVAVSQELAAALESSNV